MLLKLPALRVVKSFVLIKKFYRQNLFFFYLVLPNEKVANILTDFRKLLVTVIILVT